MPARVALLLASAACHGEPVVAPAPVPPAPFAIWQAVVTTEPFALVGDSVFAWDTKRDGIAELAANNGREVRFRGLPGVEAHGKPSFWEPIPGGYLAQFEELMSIRDHAGTLAVMWRAKGDWLGWWHVAGDVVVGARGAASSGLVALGLIDGAQRWRVAIPSDDRDLALDGDDATVLLSRERVLAVPRDTDVHRVIGAFDAATGARRWSIELPYEPRQLAFAAGGFALTTPEHELALYDGASGHATTVAIHDRYPRLIVDAGVAYVADREDQAIAAIRIRDGKHLWRTHREVGFGAGPVVRDQLLVVGTNNGSLVALDRTTGAVQWEVWTGLEGGTLYVGDHWIIEVAGKQIVGFTRPATQPELELATIHGKVARVACGTFADITIQIAGQRVAIADDGTFRTEVRAAGIVLVSGFALFADEADHPSSATVRLTGAHDYATPDLELGVCPTE